MRHIVGIDVSKAKLDCLWLRDPDKRKVKTKVIDNNRKGYQSLTHWLTKTLNASPEEIMVVMEATGIYHEHLAYTLYEHGFAVVVANPAQIKRFGESLGTTHKTDKQDSLVIARFGLERRPALWQPEPSAIRELKAFIARFESLQTDCQREQNRLEKAQFNGASDRVIESIQGMIHELEKEKKRIEREINHHIKRHPKLKKDKSLLASIPGVGPVTTRIMLTLLHSRDFKNAKQVAAFLGLIPRLVESGTLKGRTVISKKGPGWIRAKLYMAAVSAMKWNPHIKAMKERLLAKGKTNMQIVGAVMRKLVHLCFGVINRQMKYSPQVI